MIDQFDIRSLPFFGLISVIVIAVAFGAIGYLIATRRIKQPFVIFLARFGVTFFLLFLLELTVLSLFPSCHSTMQNVTTKLVSGALNLFGASHGISSSTITLQNPYLAFDVTAACLGGELFWTYIALVIAETSASNKQRFRGILIGLCILIIFNFFRIAISIYVEWLTDFRVHTLFYFFNMVFVLLVWVGWLRTLRHKPSKLINAVAH